MFEEKPRGQSGFTHERLEDERYLRPQALRRAWIAKDPQGTKFRPLGIPAVRDRVAQEVIRRLLAPIFEPLFHDCSFGFRPKRNCHSAIQRVLAYHDAGYCITLDADISGFFDNIPHKLIVDAVAEEVADGNILNLIERFLAAGVMENGIFKPTSIGTPQGVSSARYWQTSCLTSSIGDWNKPGIASCDMRMTSSLSVKRGSRPTQLDSGRIGHD